MGGPEAQLQDFVRHAPVAIAMFDRDMICLAASRRWMQSFSRGHESVVGLCHYDVHPDLPDRWKRVHRMGMAGETVTQDDEAWVQADGSTVWLRWSVMPWFREDGAVGGIVISTEDVTERTLAERKIREADALRASEAMYAGIVSISADAFVSIDDTQRITMFNDGAQDMFGYARAEVLGAPLDVLLPERLRAAHREHVARFVAGPDAARRMHERPGVAIMGLRKNGEEFSASASISKFDVAGKRIVTVSLRDTSEERRAGREQRTLADLGRILVSAGHDEVLIAKEVAGRLLEDLGDFCIVDLAADGHERRVLVLHADPARASACRALEEQCMVGEPAHLFMDVLSTRTMRLVTDVTLGDLDAIAGNEERRGTLEALAPVSLVAAPLVARSHLVGFVAVGSSRRSRLYDRADALEVERLAGLVALAVDNARLHVALQRAVRARDQVFGIVAHDLRNPLNSIVLHAQILRRRGGEPERRNQEPIDRIRTAARRMTRLIDDLLEVARLEGGQELSIHPQAASPSIAIAEAAEEVAEAVAASGRTLDVDVEPDLPDVWADRARLAQVLDNLLGNAMKFSKGKTRVTVGARRRDGEVVFRVSDEGPGIAEEALPHLFDRFWQGTSADRRGAGLGLSIVKSIVDAHGGRVWVESHPGEGTTFFFTLRVVE